MTLSCRSLTRAHPQRTLTLGLGVFLAFATLAGAQNLTYNGGPVIVSAHVVFIFWGPSFNNPASPDYNYARTLQSFRNQFGTTPEYNTITQYSGHNGTIALTNLAAGTADWFDTSTPPTDVTDAIARSEVSTYLSTHAFDDNAIYEVVLPTTSYSSSIFSGTTHTSCGGPNPGYCAYHGFYPSGANFVKYSVQPYPNCVNCQVPGWSAVQNQEKLVTHETREAVTDPQLNAWKDGNDEADDKCRFLTFFGTGGYGYQQEWSNAASGCVTSVPIGPPNYTGPLEHAGCDTLAGWAADRNRLNTSITVSIYNNGALLTTVPANASRPDVGANLGDNGLHGFSITTPPSLQDGSSHLVSVRFESSGTDLGSSPVSLTCSPPPNYAGTLDHAGCDTLAGWAADRNRLNTPITVSFYDNGALLTAILANLSRTDVGAFLGDNGLHGFSIATPSALRDGNTHTLSVRFESSGTNLALSPTSLNCSPPPVASFTFVCTGVLCSFDGSGSTGTGLTYSWDFGDSTLPNGSGVTTAHGYATIPGITDYTVTLTVTDSLGRQAFKSKRASVVHGNLLPAPNYFAVAPCRILDTRNTTILTNGQSRVVNIAGLCGIPSTAQAVSFNVAAVSPTDSGKIRLYPGNLTASWSGAKSSINFAPATSPRANSAVIQLATNGVGTLGIFPEVAGSPGQVHLILDVQGYFSTDTTPAPGAQGPLGFQTLPPCRMADTRLSNTPIAAGTVRTFTAQGVCGVPAGAAVASLHVGVPAPTASGFITLFPSNISFPGTSTINFQSGISDLRNGALLRLSSTTPDLAAYFGGAAGTNVHAYFDVNGYFKSGAPLKYYPLIPCRPVDGAVLTTGTVSTFQIRGNCGVPVWAKAALLRLVVAAPTSSGNLTVYPSNLPLSGVAVSTVKFDANEPGLSMTTIVPLSTLADDLAASPGQMTAGGTVVLSIEVFGYFQ